MHDADGCRASVLSTGLPGRIQLQSGTIGTTFSASFGTVFSTSLSVLFGQFLESWPFALHSLHRLPFLMLFQQIIFFASPSFCLLDSTEADSIYDRHRTAPLGKFSDPGTVYLCKETLTALQAPLL